MRDAAFFHLSDRLARHLRGEEVLLCNLEGEDSDFVRLNANRIRQAGGVSVWGLSLDLIQGQRQVQAHCHLSGDPEQDLAQALALIERMRERLPHVPEDPYLHYATEPSVSHRVLGAGQEAQAGDGRVDGLGRGGKGSDLGGTRQGGDDPSKAEEGKRDAPIRKGDRRGGDTWDSAEAIADVIRAAAGLDLVGIWASGTLSAGFASSLGHRHWHASRSFNLDFSCYREGDQAVKANLSGLDWEPAALERKLAAVRRDLAILGRPPREIPPGHYRAYLAPAAVAELLDMLAWGGLWPQGSPDGADAPAAPGPWRAPVRSSRPSARGARPGSDAPFHRRGFSQTRVGQPYRRRPLPGLPGGQPQRQGVRPDRQCGGGVPRSPGHGRRRPPPGGGDAEPGYRPGHR